jgi:hypothetical protein
MKRLVALLLLLSTAVATIQLVTPVNIAIEKDVKSVDLRPVGPGHEVFLKFGRATGGYAWDAVRVTNAIDPDWATATSSDQDFIYYSVRVPRDKPSGKYTFAFETIDREGLVTPEVAIVQAFVSHDPNDLLAVLPFETGKDYYADKDSAVAFKIQNKALSRARYKITSSIDNLPALGSKTQDVELDSLETKAVPVAFNILNEGEYTIRSRVWTEDNPRVDITVTTKVYVKPTITSKLKSIGRGFPLIPITMSPFYNLLGVFGF